VCTEEPSGLWDLLHSALLNWLARHGQIDWSPAVVDSCSMRAVCGDARPGRIRPIGAKRGSKRYLICDGRGTPLAVRLTGANRHDSQDAVPLVDEVQQAQAVGLAGRNREIGCVARRLSVPPCPAHANRSSNTTDRCINRGGGRDRGRRRSRGTVPGFHRQGTSSSGR
jgi:hypothetical protein